MPRAFHLRRHAYPFSCEPQRFKGDFKDRANLPDAGEVFGRAFNVDSLLQHGDGLAAMRVDIVNEFLFFGRDLLCVVRGGSKNYEHKSEGNPLNRSSPRLLAAWGGNRSYYFHVVVLSPEGFAVQVTSLAAQIIFNQSV